MNQARRKRALSGVLCMVLFAATALGMAGCSGNTSEAESEQTQLYLPADTPYSLGEGETTFPFSVLDLDGGEVLFEISTDADTVGQALLDAGLIEGEEGAYGLMVSSVNGQRFVYEEGAYWAFYIDGVYAMTGVDQTPIEAGKAYAFQAEQA